MLSLRLVPVKIRCLISHLAYRLTRISHHRSGFILWSPSLISVVWTTFNLLRRTSYTRPNHGQQSQIILDWIDHWIASALSPLAVLGEVERLWRSQCYCTWDFAPCAWYAPSQTIILWRLNFIKNQRRILTTKALSERWRRAVQKVNGRKERRRALKWAASVVDKNAIFS